MADEIRYAGYPFALVYDQPRKGAGSKVLKQALWGDWVKVTGPRQGAFVPVRVRGVSGFMATASLETKRLLEVIFVDIGQGDGCLVITPDDRFVLIDAGQLDNMARFLRWRFRGFRKRLEFEAAILSHSDLDHYGGFEDLFAEKNLFFRNVYTNGLMERAAEKAAEGLGKTVAKEGQRYLTELVRNGEELDGFLSEAARWQRKRYPTMLRKAREAGKFGNFQMLSVRDGHVPGFGVGENEVTMELLGPVPEEVGGKMGLRWLGDVGKTKNGHSVVVRMRYGKVRIFAGGDLNIPSESLLLGHHAGAAVPETEEERRALVEAAREKLGADFAKACHHGSSDVSRAFLEAIHPMATVISSGDDEPHSHPRPDTLGILGKCSRGERPAIFSTELARSAPERIREPQVLRAQLDELVAELRKAASEQDAKKIEKRIETLKKSLERSVATYGAINLRTDGERAIVAQKLERKPGKSREWDIYRFEPNEETGELEYVSKHED